MLYDRSYMKAKKVTYEWPVLRWILITLVVVYFIQCIANWSLNTSFVETQMGLSWYALRDFKLWTVFTYGLLHDPHSPFHLLCNGLATYFLGRYLQMQMGGKNLAKLTAGAILMGAAFWIISHIHHGKRPQLLMGFSAAVSAYLAIWCLKNWYERVRLMLFFVIPIETTGKILFWSFLAFEGGFFLAIELWRGSGLWGVAHSAHIGGIVAGWAFFRYALGETIHGSLFRPVRPERRPWYQKRPVATPVFKQKINIVETPRAENSKAIKAEVDRILDKINANGFGSLSAEEKATLDKARDLLKH